MNEIIVLDVPFSEKNEAKMLGARWNSEIKKWYVPKNLNSKPFIKWIQSEKENSEQKTNKAVS